MLPLYYEFYNPVKIISGRKALENIPHELETMQVHTPMIVTDKGVVDNGLLDIVLNCMKGSGITIGVIYADTPPDSSIVAVNKAAELFKANNCDSIIAVGGGSVIDTAKGINIVISEETDDIIRFVGAERLTKVQKPFIAIPTTSGTGSEVTLVSVIYNPDKNVKMAFTSNLLLPKVTILDPRMTLGLPPFLTAATGMDALTHAVEAYSCIQKNPLSDAHAIAAITLVRENLIEAVKNGKNEQARLALANASLFAGAAFSNSMVGSVHGLGHATGAVAHTHHGMTMAILLPHVMDFNLEKASGNYAALLLHLAGEEIYIKTPAPGRAKKAIETIRIMNQTLRDICGMSVTLSQAGVKEDQLEEIAKKAMGDGSMMFNPIEMEYNDALGVLKAAF